MGGGGRELRRDAFRRYPGALDIDIEWTREVLADSRLVAVVPYPRSRMGAAAFVGWSPSARRVLLMLAYQISKAICTALTPGRPLAETSPPTTRGTTMTKKLDDNAAAALREDARTLEQHANSGEPYPEGTVISRPNGPSRMLNLRLSDEQFRRVATDRECQASADVDHGSRLAARPARRGATRFLTSRRSESVDHDSFHRHGLGRMSFVHVTMQFVPVLFPEPAGRPIVSRTRAGREAAGGGTGSRRGPVCIKWLSNRRWHGY